MRHDPANLTELCWSLLQNYSNINTDTPAVAILAQSGEQLALNAPNGAE